MDVCLVWAQALDGAIGKDNKLPWHLPEDLAHFKRLTHGSSIIMGRKTWESIGSRALPGRVNIVVSRRPAPPGVSALWLESLDAAIAAARTNSPTTASGIYIIGGAEIYAQALPLADRLVVTEVQASVPGADAFAPRFSADRYELIVGPLETSSSRLRFRIKTYALRQVFAASKAQGSPA